MHRVPAPLEVHLVLGPQRAQQRHLLLGAGAPDGEILLQRGVFVRAASDPDAQSHPTTR